MSPGSLNLESQLLSIMDVLMKTAATEISQLFSESSASLRLHLTQSLKENETLRMRMKVMRSELFTLRLQTKMNRPASRFSTIRGNIHKPRAKLQVVVNPPVSQKSVGEVASISLQSETKTSFSATQVECADVESPDVILIKDEDDVGCGPVAGQDDFGNHNVKDGVAMGTQDSNLAGSSCLTENDGELRIMSVHGCGEGPLLEERTLFTASELQAFSSLSPDHNVAHDSLLNFTAGVSGRATMQTNGVGLARRNSTQMASADLTPAVKTPTVGPDSHVGYPSHVSQLPHQQNFLPHGGNKSLDCSFCGKSFVNKTTLGIHMRIHTGEKPYACMQCGKRFTQNGSLKIHLRTHSGEKPYTCRWCTASFNNPSNLRRHMVTHSTQTVKDTKVFQHVTFTGTNVHIQA